MKARSLWVAAPRQVELREEEIALPLGDEVLIEALYSGVSHGSEMLVYRGEVPDDLELDATLNTMKGSFAFPIKYGYSSVGRVVETGPDTTGLCIGDIVFVHHPHQTHYVVPERMAYRIPGGVTPLHGIFVASVETALNCVLDCGVRIGESVAIFGQGVIGLLLVELMKMSGAGMLFAVDGIERRRALSSKLGADYVLDPGGDDVAKNIRRLTGGVGVDVAVEASGTPKALDSAIKATSFQGLVLVVSWYGSKPVTLGMGAEFHRHRLIIKSSQVSNINPELIPRWSRERRMSSALALLPKLRLSELISDVVPFAEAGRAYDMIDRHPEVVLQVVLSYV